MNIDKKAVGKRISLIRKEKGMTLEEFGELVGGAGKSIVSKWERGITIPSNPRLKQISQLGNVSMNYLLYENETTIFLDEYLQRKSIGYTLAFLKKEIENLRKFIDESADIQTKKMLRLRLEDLEKDYKLFLEIEKELWGGGVLFMSFEVMMP